MSRIPTNRLEGDGVSILAGDNNTPNCRASRSDSGFGFAQTARSTPPWLVLLSRRMIERTQGDLLDAGVQALVNTVNTVGIMGKGIALQFKKAFPENYSAYRKACAAGLVTIGRMFVHDLGVLASPRYIINFPTKQHWRSKSKIADIKSGLTALVDEVQRLGIESIALPPLGCGHGGLEWSEVAPLIEKAFADLPNVQVLVFEPADAPPPEAMPAPRC